MGHTSVTFTKLCWLLIPSMFAELQHVALLTTSFHTNKTRKLQGDENPNLDLFQKREDIRKSEDKHLKTEQKIYWPNHWSKSIDAAIMQSIFLSNWVLAVVGMCAFPERLLSTSWQRSISSVKAVVRVAGAQSCQTTSGQRYAWHSPSWLVQSLSRWQTIVISMLSSTSSTSLKANWDHTHQSIEHFFKTHLSMQKKHIVVTNKLTSNILLSITAEYNSFLSSKKSLLCAQNLQNKRA